MKKRVNFFVSVLLLIMGCFLLNYDRMLEDMARTFTLSKWVFYQYLIIPTACICAWYLLGQIVLWRGKTALNPIVEKIFRWLLLLLLFLYYALSIVLIADHFFEILPDMVSHRLNNLTLVVSEYFLLGFTLHGLLLSICMDRMLAGRRWYHFLCSPYICTETSPPDAAAQAEFPNNGPVPGCQLVSCLESAGKIFTTDAG